MEKPTIILVPGAWHRPSQYTALTKPLEEVGFKVVGIELRSTFEEGKEKPADGWSEDCERIQKAIKAEAADGKKVVILTHSYGGIPGSQACEGLEEHVTRLVFLAAFAIDVGGSLWKALGEQLLPWMEEFKGSIECINIDPIFYNDCSKEVTAQEKKKLLVHSLGSFKQEVTYAGWKHVPSVYIVCDRDMAIPNDAQKGMASQEGKWEYAPLTIDGGHIPWLASPEITVQTVMKAVA